MEIMRYMTRVIAFDSFRYAKRYTSRNRNAVHHYRAPKLSKLPVSRADTFTCQ